MFSVGRALRAHLFPQPAPGFRPDKPGLPHRGRIQEADKRPKDARAKAPNKLKAQTKSVAQRQEAGKAKSKTEESRYSRIETPKSNREYGKPHQTEPLGHQNTNAPDSRSQT